MLRSLPVEEGPPTTPRPVPGAAFSLARVQPVANPRVVAVAADALKLLDLDPAEVGTSHLGYYVYSLMLL